jgi:CHAT domain-containing protein
MPEMRLPQPFAILAALWLAAAGVTFPQVTSTSVLDEKIRQADEFQDKGNLPQAREIYESALKSLRVGEPSSQLGHVLNELSNVASAEGNYRQAVEYAQQAASVYHQSGDAKGEAFALNCRGIAEGSLGLYPTAQSSLRQALALTRGIGDSETEVRTLNNLGNAYYWPGEYLEALRAYQDAWHIVESKTEKWSDYWRQLTKINEATLYQRLGRYQSALQLYQQAGTSKGLTASDQAHVLTNLGALYRRLGDSWKALESYRSALSLYSREHDSTGEIRVLKNLGITYAMDQGDLAKAQRFFDRSLSLAQKTHNLREEMQAHLYLGETMLRKMQVRAGHAELELALAQARQLGTTEEQWKALYGIGRAQELSGRPMEAEAEYREAIAIIETTRTQLQLSALRAEFLADKRDAYDALIALLLKKNTVKDAFLYLERSRARAFQDRLASTTPSGETPNPAPPGLDEIRKYLDPSTILMEYWVSRDEIALIWCTRQAFGMEQTHFSEGERDGLMRFLRELPNNLGVDWRQNTAVLARLIPGNLSLPADIRHAVIVPDGWLSSVPFDLVPAADNSGIVLIERVDISYLPTAALLLRVPAPESGLRFPWTLEFVAFGNPVLPERLATSETFGAPASLQRLPYAAEEIQSISKMVRGRAELFLGTADLKRVFLAGKAHRAPIMHVGTHAFADADNPESSRILFSPENSNGAADYLFLRELYDLDLREVDLATLSACNTERGKMIRGEGVQAFSRALLAAGSHSALTTLWRVGDQPTSEFMKQFYYFTLEKGQTKSEALRSAKLKFLHSKTSLEGPAHWAGFVMNGDGTGTLPYFVSWNALIVVLTVPTLVFALVLWFLLGRRGRSDRVDRAEGVVSQ